MISLAQICHETESIAREAGALLRIQQQNFSSDRIEIKSLNALVSYVDINTEKLLVKRLGALLPEAGFLTEEGTTIQDQNKEYYWVIDPLDGTTNFMHGLPIYSVSIALMKGNEPVIGVVYEVGMDECFAAYKGGGARLNGNTIAVSPTSDLAHTLLATGFPYYDFSNVQGFQDTLEHFYPRTRGIRRIGTAAVDLAYTACGRFDGYFEYGLSPWDVAAGILLVLEAGGVVCDFNGGEAPIQSKSLVATNKNAFEAVFSVVNNYLGNA
ncbi:MAG: hypothetical protein RL754_1171 [Bacteroidota bacterium]|jgi:myo-inositol-1(or 4)-monophosphatase